jgi:uncharacterized protein (DUF1800 family)
MQIKHILHLMNRAGFGCSYREAKSRAQQQDPVSDLFTNDAIVPLDTDLPPASSITDQKMSEQKREKTRKDHLLRTVEINRMWFNQMILTPYVLREKMTLFWTNHFVVDHKTPLSALPYNNLLRKHALGNFRDLTLAVAKSPSMINYLHLRQNVKGAPNEDFARELCELFTLGRDNVYTEEDIKEIARAFTGWKIGLDLEFRFVPRQHDYGTKTIFGQTGNFSGEEVIDLILEQPATARFLSQKLYRAFVQETPNPNHIQELADVLYQNDYEIKPWLQHLFRADWFYREEVVGNQIKSPTELLVMMGRQFGFTFANGDLVIRLQKLLGQVLFTPPNVAGWPGGKDWIDASRLILRLQLGTAVLQGAEVVAYEKAPLDTMPEQVRTTRRIDLKIEQIDLSGFQQDHRTLEEEQQALLVAPPPAGLQFGSDLPERLAQYTSLPEYQLC